MSAIIGYLRKIATLTPAFVIAVMIIRLLRRKSLRKKGYSSSLMREVLLGIYLIIIFALLSQTVFSDLDSFMQDGWFNVNLTPMKFVVHMMNASDTYFLINVLGNILFFIPVGLLSPMLFRGNSFLTSVGSGFSISLLVEILQLPLLRATDIDDLILNTSGAFAGFVLYKILSNIFPGLKTSFRIKKSRPY